MTGPLRLLDRFSLRDKILFPVAGTVALLFAAVLLILSSRIQRQTREMIEVDFRQTRATFEQFLSREAEILVDRAVLLSEHPLLKGAVEVAGEQEVTAQAHRTVLENVDFLTGLTAIELAVVTNEQGLVIHRTDRAGEFGSPPAGLTAIRSALEGRDPESTSFWLHDGQVWQVASVPIFANLTDLIGTLTLGTLLGRSVAEELRENTGSEVSFLSDHRVVASTLPPEAQVDLAKATFTFGEQIGEAAAEGRSTGPLRVRLMGESYLISLAGTGSGQGEAGITYAVAQSLDRALAPLRRLQVVIILLGLAAVAAAGVVSWLLARRITAPVQRLVEGAHRIEAGNYDFSIRAEAEDEIGTLARAFNEMTAGLRERFQMEKYVSSSTLEMLRRGREAAGEEPASGERRNVTVLFSDIRGFTAFSENRDPEDVVAMLNMYLSKQARAVSRHGGFVDKFVGDELVAVFEGEDMVDDAVRCAVEIQEEMKGLYEQLPHKVRVGIGIHTGMVVMGNMGSEERMDYTVLGSNVNLGSRLCSMAEPGQIVLSESSYRLLRHKVRTTPLEPVQVKGISRPVQTYEVG